MQTICCLYTELNFTECLCCVTGCLQVFLRLVWQEQDWLVKLSPRGTVVEGLCPLKRNILLSAQGWMSLQIEMHLGVSMGGNNVQQ